MACRNCYLGHYSTCLLYTSKFNEEIDEIGHHNNTVTVDEFTQFGPDFSKAYWIVGDDGRKYTISEGMHNKLNAEYNNSVAGHKLNIFFNVKKQPEEVISIIWQIT